MDNGQISMDRFQWTMDKFQWIMDSFQWTSFNGQFYTIKYWVMKNINLSIVCLCLLFFQIKLVSQTIGLQIDKKTLPLHRSPFGQYFSEKKRFQMPVNPYSIKKDTLKPHKMPSLFSVETLPFFCKIEYKMGLQKKLPIKFRLGDVQYVDELERKRNN